MGSSPASSGYRSLSSSKQGMTGSSLKSAPVSTSSQLEGSKRPGQGPNSTTSVSSVVSSVGTTVSVFSSTMSVDGVSSPSVPSPPPHPRRAAVTITTMARNQRFNWNPFILWLFLVLRSAMSRDASFWDCLASYGPGRKELRRNRPV